MSKCREQVHQFTEKVWNQKNFQIYEDTIHQEFQYHDPVMPSVNNKDEYKSFISRIQSTSPDMHYETMDVVAESEKVVVLYSWTGTPVREVAGIPPSGKKLEHKGIAIYYFDNDKIVKIWDVWDRYSLIRQLGIIS